MTDALPKLRLLVVDDNQAIRNAIVQAAHELDRFEIREAEDGLRGLATYTKFLPHIVLTDFEMPVMDGAKFISALRRQDGADKVIVVMLTARADERDVVLGLNADADEYLHKPVRPEEIRARLLALSRIVDLQARLADAMQELRDLQTARIAEQRNRIASFISAGLSHELNSPLQALLGNLSFIATVVKEEATFRGEDPKEVVGLLEKSLALVTRISGVAERIEQFQKAGREAEPVDTLLAPLLDEALRYTDLQAPIPCSIVCPADLRVHIDTLHLRIALTALVDALRLRGATSMRIEVVANAKQAVQISMISTHEQAPDLESMRGILNGGFDQTNLGRSQAEFGLCMANDCLKQNNASVAFAANGKNDFQVLMSLTAAN